MPITIKKRPEFGGAAIFHSDDLDMTAQAIAAMREALPRGSRLNLRDANLRNANLQDADLRYADLQGADLRDASLRDANLRNGNLQDASFGGGEAGCGLAPELLGLPLADPAYELRVIEAALAPGALEMGQWHTCETTHCIAGWAVHLAGAAGKALEAVTSSSCAGAILVPGLAHLFYASNKEATAALRARLAELSTPTTTEEGN